MKRRKQTVTVALLNERSNRAAQLGYSEAKWIQFCRYFLARGYEVKLHEAKQTVSKYIYLRKDSKVFKVRFSNHKPIKYMELIKDCDFFVGHTNQTITTTRQAAIAARVYFGDGITTMLKQES